MTSETRYVPRLAMLSKDGINFTCNVFRPVEAAEMTGLSALMQRDWRDRGYLPAATGHARYDVFDIAQIYIMRMLSDFGFGPKISSQYSSFAANSIVFHAINTADAYDNCEEILSKQKQIEDIRRSLIDKEYWHDYMVYWSDYTVEFCDDIGEAFSRQNAAMRGSKFLKQEGPVLVLPLVEIGAKLTARSPRPFIRLLSDKEASKLGRIP